MQCFPDVGKGKDKGVKGKKDKSVKGKKVKATGKNSKGFESKAPKGEGKEEGLEEEAPREEGLEEEAPTEEEEAPGEEDFEESQLQDTPKRRKLRRDASYASTASVAGSYSSCGAMEQQCWTPCDFEGCAARHKTWADRCRHLYRTHHMRRAAILSLSLSPPSPEWARTRFAQ